MAECGGFTRGSGQPEGLTRQSVIPSGSSSVEIRMTECGGFTRGVGQPEGLTRQSVIPSSSSSAAINLNLRSPQDNVNARRRSTN